MIPKRRSTDRDHDPSIIIITKETGKNGNRVLQFLQTRSSNSKASTYGFDGSYTIMIKEGFWFVIVHNHENGGREMKGFAKRTLSAVLVAGMVMTNAPAGTLMAANGGISAAQQVSGTWVKENGNWYYRSGSQNITGWLDDGGKVYYLDPATGIMKKGWIQVDGEWFYLKDGVVRTGWLKISTKWYFFDADGAMLTGIVKDGGVDYLLDGSGALAVNKWVSLGSEWYYTNSSGALRKSTWAKSGGKWYYLGSDGKMVKGCTMNIGGTDYTFDANGVWVENAVATPTPTKAPTATPTKAPTATPTPTSGAGQQTRPPYPFWKQAKSYGTSGTLVYYKGKIYRNKWWANAGEEPGSGDNAWELVGDAEWTVPEKADNYTDATDDYGNPIGSGGGSSATVDRILTDAEIEAEWGGINDAYSPENAVGRLEDVLVDGTSYVGSKSEAARARYNNFFPYRFGTDAWKTLPSSAQYYPDYQSRQDYYSFDNLQAAISDLANIMIKVEWYEQADWCYRIIRLDKTTHEQRLLCQVADFDSDWIQQRARYSNVVDLGSFLAAGTMRDRKKELAAFLAITSHETGGGNIDGIVTQDQSGYYFIEEVGYIGNSACGYTAGTTFANVSYQAKAGKSYHGRGPIQISYPFNYGLCSDIIFNDADVLLDNPESVCASGKLGFEAAICFWMTPQPPKPSCHEVITGTWVPNPGSNNTEYNGLFGLTIVIVNGETNQSENGGAGAVPRRCFFFRLFCQEMGVDLGNEQVDTVGMTSFMSTNK